MPLTDTAIRVVKPAAKPFKLADERSLYLLITPAGGKLWRMDYRFEDKRKTLALGSYPDVNLKQARDRRDEARRQLADGIDPMSKRQEAKATRRAESINNFEAVAREWYKKQCSRWSKSHSTDVLRRLEVNLFKPLGGRPIAKIDAPELLKAIEVIENRGAHELAHRVLQVAGQVFRYGIITSRCSRDPSADLKGALTPVQKTHQAAVKPEEMGDLIQAINRYDQVGTLQTKLGLQLLCLTFVRTSELIGAVWDEIDWSNALWMIPAARMKMKTDHHVPLAKQTIALLEQVQAIAGESRYLFPGVNPCKTMSNNTMLFALYRLGYKGKMTGHGFRAVASTILNEQGYRADVIERQLAHTERNAVRAAYNRAEYLPERRKMMQDWADYIESLGLFA
ncbi:MAG: tyrosine-type recombinase/integrase [Holosporaceae bacterium]|nr:tyrosine-type recombinase/integrase [Rhodospirillaceae bacterium]